MLSMYAWWAAVPVFLAAALANGQAATQWCDNVTDVCFWRHYLASTDTTWGYLFPSTGATDEFIGIFVAPTQVGWIGNSLGGGMLNNPLLVGWMNGSSPVVSVRWASNMGPPAVHTGPRVTILGSSGVNATHQRIVYRCQDCTTWVGGSNGINLNGAHDFGYTLHGSIKPLTPEESDSSLYQHTAAGRHSINVSSAKSPLYAQSLQQLINAPPLGGQPTPTTTTTAPVPTGTLSCPGAPQSSYTLNIAPGWRAVPVLGRLTSPRGITLDNRGNLLVVERGKGITIHTLNAEGCVQSSKTLIADTGLNHGIDINPAGDKLYASSSDMACVWDYNDASQSVSNKRTLITGMHNPGHVTRTLRVSRKNPNMLYVSVGSDGNIDIPSLQASSGRSQIRVFDVRTLTNANGVSYASNGKVMGYGLRNDVGMDEDPSGVFFSVENSVDNAYRQANGQRRDVHNDNPAEKVYRLGTADAPANIFGGYPYCFTVWQPSDFIDKTFQVGDWFSQDTTSTYNDAWCNANSVKPVALLPPHTAPLDMKFGIGSDANLYVTLHGSWNRNPPQGYKVVTIPGRYTVSGEWTPTVDLAGTKASFADLLKNTNENSCTFGCFRPVGLVFDRTGANLYISSDTSGEIFLMKRNSGPVTTITTTSTTTTTTTSTTTTNQGPTTLPPIITTTTTTSTAPQPTQTVWGQCGGNNYNGPCVCTSGSTCRFQNEWHSQCVPS